MRKPKTGILTLLALSLVALFSVGCGDSESFVFTGPVTNPNPDTTGNLQFRFNTVNAQTAADLPEGTTQLFFSLHTGNPPSNANLNAAIGPVAVSSLNADGTYVLEGVDPDVNTVVVVARSADGFPLAAWQATGIEVVVGETVLVDLGGAEPITFEVVPSPNPLRLQRDGGPVQLDLTLNFSNGSSIPLTSYNTPEVTFTGVDPTVANFTTTGQFSAITGVGNTGTNDTATVTYNLFGREDSADFGIQVFDFQVFNTSPTTIGETEPDVPITFNFDFLGSNGVRVLGDQTNANISLSLQSQVPGITLQSDDTLDAVNADADGPNVVIVVTYTDPTTGFQATDTFEVDVLPPS